jgi:hypothetical protein
MSRPVLALLLLSLFSCDFLSAQQRLNPKEQKSFSLEEPFENRVAVPAEVLQILRAPKDTDQRDTLNRCAQEDGISVSEVPDSWFEAAQIALTVGEPRGLVIKAQNACLWHAHTGPYWVFRRLATGYQLVFVGEADWLDVKRTRTNEYRDLELVYSLEGGRTFGYSKYCFQQGQYLFCGRRTVHHN